MRKFLSLVTLWFCLFDAANAANLVVVLEPEKQSIEQDEAFAVDIIIKNAPLMQQGHVSVHFDPDVVHAVGMVFSGVWNESTLAGQIDNNAGTIENMRFSAQPGVYGQVPIATIWFEAVHEGVTTLSISPPIKIQLMKDKSPAGITTFDATVTVVPSHHPHHEH
jgi:hypothetical protein